MIDEMYETPEGFQLPRRLLMPEARSFADVLTFVRVWDHETMTHQSGRVKRPELIPDPVNIDGNEVGPFCSVQMGQNRYAFAVIPTDATVETLTGQFVTDDDRISFKVILHEDRDRCLIIADHNKIIGSRWLAYVDPATVRRAGR